MNKTIMFLGMLAVSFANAQQEGRVGINTDAPKATLDVKSISTDEAKGVLLPQLTGDELKTMTPNLTEDQHGLITFAKDGVSTLDNLPTNNVQFAGYHRFSVDDILQQDGSTQKVSSWVRLEPSGLEKIKGEGDKIGWRLIGREFGRYVTIGSGAVDLSFIRPGEDLGKPFGASGAISVAMNFGTLASAFAATAMGYKTIASGYHSLTSGSQTVASGSNAVAIGQQSKSSNNNTFASGYRTTASGNNAVAFGENTTSSGNRSFAIGFGSTASGNQSFASGESSQATGRSSFATGYRAIASGDFSIALGQEVTASGPRAVALGDTNTAASSNSTAIGVQNKANGAASLAAGGFSETKGYASMTIGFRNIAEGTQSFVGGSSSKTIGENTFAYGNNLEVRGSTSAAVGFDNIVTGNSSFSAGAFSTIDTKGGQDTARRLLTIGNGDNSTNRSDALAVLYNGKVGINIDNFEITTSNARLQVNGAIKVSSDSDTCNADNAGTIRFKDSKFQGCIGTDWVDLH